MRTLYIDCNLFSHGKSVKEFKELLKTFSFYVMRDGGVIGTCTVCVCQLNARNAAAGTSGSSNSIRWWLPSQMLSCQSQQILRDPKPCYDHFLSTPSPREQFSCSSYYLVTLLLLHYCYIGALYEDHMGTQLHSSDWRHHSNGAMDDRRFMDGNGLKCFTCYQTFTVTGVCLTF